MIPETAYEMPAAQNIKVTPVLRVEISIEPAFTKIPEP
jgi:hypothetical protein